MRVSHIHLSPTVSRNGVVCHRVTHMMLETIPMAPGIMLYRMVWNWLRPKPWRMRGPNEVIPPETSEMQKTEKKGKQAVSNCNLSYCHSHADRCSPTHS
jgi:hypothetical protein